jgi:hypothetical protein
VPLRNSRRLDSKEESGLVKCIIGCWLLRMIVIRGQRQIGFAPLILYYKTIRSRK